jgi:hypothetical protein
MAQGPTEPELSITIMNPGYPVVLRINGDPQGTGPGGSGLVADGVLVHILLQACNPISPTTDFELWAQSYGPTTDPQAAVRQKIGDLSSIPGQLEYFFRWQPDSAMPSGAYQIAVEGRCTGVSDNWVELYDRRDYPLVHGEHFSTVHVFYGDTGLYSFDLNPSATDQACVHDQNDPRPIARYWVEECLLSALDDDILPKEASWGFPDFTGYTDVLEIYATYHILLDPVRRAGMAEGLPAISWN